MVFHVQRYIIYVLERAGGKTLLLKQTLRLRFTISGAYESRSNVFSNPVGRHASFPPVRACWV